jgi:broad specificity phosphatase PhoE
MESEFAFFFPTTIQKGFVIDQLNIRSAQQVTDRLDDLIKEIKSIQQNHMHGEPGPADVVLVAHGHLLRAFVKRWLGYPMEFPLSLMLPPGGIGVLRCVKEVLSRQVVYLSLLPATNIITSMNRRFMPAWRFRNEYIEGRTVW